MYSQFFNIFSTICFISFDTEKYSLGKSLLVTLFFGPLYFLYKECLHSFHIHLPFSYVVYYFQYSLVPFLVLKLRHINISPCALQVVFYYFWCQKVIFRKDHQVNSLICGTIISTICTNYVGISKNTCGITFCHQYWYYKEHLSLFFRLKLQISLFSESISIWY